MKIGIEELEASGTRSMRVIISPRESEVYANGMELLVRVYAGNANLIVPINEYPATISWFVISYSSLCHLTFLISELLFNEDFPRWRPVEKWYNFDALFL